MILTEVVKNLRILYVNQSPTFHWNITQAVYVYVTMYLHKTCERILALLEGVDVFLPYPIYVPSFHEQYVIALREVSVSQFV